MLGADTEAPRRRPTTSSGPVSSDFTPPAIGVSGAQNISTSTVKVSRSDTFTSLINAQPEVSGLGIRDLLREPGRRGRRSSGSARRTVSAPPRQSWRPAARSHRGRLWAQWFSTYVDADSPPTRAWAAHSCRARRVRRRPRSFVVIERLCWGCGPTCASRPRSDRTTRSSPRSDRTPGGRLQRPCSVVTLLPTRPTAQPTSATTDEDTTSSPIVLSAYDPTVRQRRSTSTRDHRTAASARSPPQAAPAPRRRRAMQR